MLHDMLIIMFFRTLAHIYFLIQVQYLYTFIISFQKNKSLQDTTFYQLTHSTYDLFPQYLVNTFITGTFQISNCLEDGTH